MRWSYLVSKSLKVVFKASEDEVRDIEMSYDIISDELAYMVKKIKRVTKFNKRLYKHQEFGKKKKT